MPYTVYIPDVDRGPLAYTQRQFATIKELARWAMDAALEEAPAAPVVAEAAPDASAPAPAATVKETEWNIDISAWMEPTDPLFAAVGARSWSAVAEYFCMTIRKNGFKDAVSSWYVSEEELALFFKLLIDSPVSQIVDSLLPDTTCRWDLLPAEFSGACRAWEVETANTRCFSRLVPSMPVTENFHAIYTFIKNGLRYSTWKDTTIELEGVGEWNQKNTRAIVEAVVRAWWSGEKVTPEIRAFLTKACVVQLFDQCQGSTYGAEGFLTTFTRTSRTVISLPPALMDWAMQGLNHKHCKAILGELGITQVRRAEGQKYVGLAMPRSLTGSYEGTSTVVYGDDLPGIYDDPGLSEFGLRPF